MRWSSVCALAAVGWVLAVPTALADTATIAMDDDDAVLTETDGGGWTTTVGFTNLTDADIDLVATATGCQPTLDQDGTLPEARHRAFTVTIPQGCGVEDDRFAFSVEASEAPVPAPSFEITATADAEDEQPTWDNLWVFLGIPAVLALLSVVLFRHWTNGNKLDEPLLYLDDGWSFKDSWVSNVTIGGGLLTGLFGSSEVVKTFLGDDADAAVALGTVGAAIAIAFVGAGGLVLLAFKSRKANSFTVFGLMAAAVVTLAGAGGELWVVYVSAREVTGGELHDYVLPVVVGIGELLLLTVGVRSLLVTLDTGITPPPDPDYTKPPLPETIFAASMIVETLKASGQVDEAKVQAAVDGLVAETQAAKPPPARRRGASAML